MSTPVSHTSIESALRAALPAGVDADIAGLAQLLADLLNHQIRPEEAQNCLAVEPRLAALLPVLVGKTLEGGTSTISFGTGNQIGTVTVGDVAGRDVIKITVPPVMAHYPEAPIPPPLDYQTDALRQVVAHLKASGVTRFSTSQLARALPDQRLRDRVNPLFEPLSLAGVADGLQKMVQAGALVHVGGDSFEIA